MMGWLKDIFRRRSLKKDASTVPTGMIPMSEIHSADVVIDVEETGFDVLKEDILSWGRQNGIRVNIFFLDFRKLGKDELLLTSIQTTILKRELNWFGKPCQEKVALLTGADLFISMVDNRDYPIEYLSKCSGARFKIGRKDFDVPVYDITVSGEEAADLRSDSRRVFAGITELLTKIKQ